MPDRPLFLERASFRRRRLGDAARVLPVLAAILVLVPVWWMPAQVSLRRADAATLRASREIAGQDDDAL